MQHQRHYQQLFLFTSSHRRLKICVNNHNSLHTNPFRLDVYHIKMQLTTLLTPAFLATITIAQLLNTWKQQIFPICCSSMNDLIDGDPNTSTALRGNTITLLHNTRETYTGFYIKSSGLYITDVSVTYYSAFFEDIVVGVSHSDVPGWLAVGLYQPDGEPGARADIFTITVTGTAGNGTETFINEIYPIYPGDEIIFPAGAPPPPNYQPIETFLDLPTGPGLVLNRWPMIPDVQGGINNAALVDRNVDTVATLDKSSGGYTFTFTTPKYLSGIYILTNGPRYFASYKVLAKDTKTDELVEVCSVQNDGLTFTACAFHGPEDGAFAFSSEFLLVVEEINGGGDIVDINEIWPVFLGERLIDPRTVVTGQK